MSWWRGGTSSRRHEAQSASKTNEEDELPLLAPSALPMRKPISQRNLTSLLKQRLLDLTGQELGISDICCVIWSVPTQSSIMRGRQDIVEIHHVTGVNCTTPAHIAAYIQQHILIRQRENAYTITPVKAIFCIHDIVKNWDVRTEILFPGTVHSSGVDQNGQPHVIEEYMWSHIWLSNILRCLVHHESSLDTPSYQLALNPLSHPRSLETLADCLYKGYPRLVDALNHRLNICQMPYDNILLEKLCSFLARQHLDTQASLLCRRLIPYDQRIAAVSMRCLASANFLKYKELDLAEGIRQVVRAGVQNAYPASCLLVEQAAYCLRIGRLADAITLARAATVAKGADNYAWLQLAESYIEADCPRLALCALNCLKFTSSDVPLPQSKLYNYPSGQVRKIPFQDDKFLARLRASMLTGLPQRSYKIILSIVQKFGWSQFLVFRQETFFTHPQNEAACVNARWDMKEEIRQAFSIHETVPALILLCDDLEGDASSDEYRQVELNHTSSSLKGDATSLIDENEKQHSTSEVSESDPASGIRKRELDEPTKFPDCLTKNDITDTTYILNEIIHTYLLEHGSTKPSLTQEYQETACDSDYNSPKKETNNYQPLTIKYNEAYNNQHHVHIVVGTHDVNVRQRLCRRWLDNMCLIVYEDLCCYVLHTGGMPGIETDAARVTESRTRVDWLRLGMLAHRLGNTPFAAGALHTCIDLCPSRSTLKLRASLLLAELMIEMECLDELIDLFEQIEKLLLEVDVDVRVPLIYRRVFEIACSASVVFGQQKVYDKLLAACGQRSSKQDGADNKYRFPSSGTTNSDIAIDQKSKSAAVAADFAFADGTDFQGSRSLESDGGVCFKNDTATSESKLGLKSFHNDGDAPYASTNTPDYVTVSQQQSLPNTNKHCILAASASATTTIAAVLSLKPLIVQLVHDLENWDRRYWS